MKSLNYFIGALLILNLSACGKGDDDQDTLPSQTIIERTVAAPSGFQGYYILPNGGYAEVLNDPGNLQDINQLRLIVSNADTSTGLIPLSSMANMPTINGKVIYTGNLNYQNSNNVKNDFNNNQLTGSLFTMVTLSLNSGKLNVRIQISSSTGLVFDHTLISN